MLNNDIWEQLYKGLSYFDSYLPEWKMLKNTTHIPLLLSVIDMFKHDFILEFGAGMFSTPIFYHNYVKKFVTVEDSAIWIKFIEKELPVKNGFVTRNTGFLFTRPNRVKELAFYELNIEQQERLLKCYRKLYRKYDNIDILFIDQIKYGRGKSIKQFYNKSNIIIFHDCQHIHRFGYEIINDILKEEKYNLYIHKTIPAYTGILIKKDIDFDYNRLSEKIELYEKKHFNMICDKNNNFFKNTSNSIFKFVKQEKL